MKYLILSAVVLFAFSSLFGQKVPDKTLEGYAYGVTGLQKVKKTDTIRGYITIYNPIARQEKAVFYADMSNVRTKKVWMPEKVKGYFTDDKTYEAIAWPKASDNTPQSYAEVVKRGKISMYAWYVIAPHAQRQNPKKAEESYDPKELQKITLIKKGNGPVEDFTSFKFHNFKKSMSEYLKEDKALAAKIEKGELGIDKMEEIVDEYNAWADSKHKSSH